MDALRRLLLARSDKGSFVQRTAFEQALRAESREIQLGLDAENLFRQISTHGRRLLESMTRKSVGQKKPLQIGPLTEDCVAIDPVDRIEAGPTVGESESVEGWNYLGQLRPKHVVESTLAPRESNTDWIVVHGSSYQDAIVALAAKVETRGKADQRQRLPGFDLGVDKKRLSLHWIYGIATPAVRSI